MKIEYLDALDALGCIGADMRREDIAEYRSGLEKLLGGPGPEVDRLVAEYTAKVDAALARRKPIRPLSETSNEALLAALRGCE